MKKAITGADLFFMERKRVAKLWEIREQTRPASWKELRRSFRLLDENAKDFDEVMQRYSWF